MAGNIPKLLVLTLLALGTFGQESSPSLDELVRDLHLRLNLMSLEFHEQMEQLVTEQQLLRQSVEKLSWVVDRVDQSMNNIVDNHDVVMRNLSHVTSQSDAIMVNQQFCANHDRLRDLYFETLPRCQGPPLPPVTTEPTPTSTQIPPITSEPPAVYASCRHAPPVSGVYSIEIDRFVVVRLYCEQELQDGGWMVFQSRMHGTVDFNRSYAEYRSGFGNVSHEYWLGLDNLHLLTNLGVELLIDMEDFAGVAQFARYSNFAIESAATAYTLRLGGTFSGTAGDALSNYFAEEFTTFDRRVGASGNCAETLASGFWHYDCGIDMYRNNLNGIYGFNKGQQGVWWGTFDNSITQNRSPLKTVRMMVRQHVFERDGSVKWFEGPKN
ncbi:angiopoietin-related protein 1-like [Culex pipiens pallens]|uniref:angiopoietin-related protein 1-like n=1 Tax=Culex pipiens pallens TaxID=42434 RepID=UPI001953B853|nr:angiopoietin-related protein 1-like [Culex pipiens pallens]